MKRTGFIYAKRMRGDIELNDDPTTSRLHRLARILAPGKRLLTEQGIYEAEDDKKYAIGSRLVMDERVFRYARIGGVDALGARAVANLSTAQQVALAADDSAVGLKTATITVTALNLEENELQGGYLCYKNVRYYRHRIFSHPAVDVGDPCVLTLETAIVGHEIESGVTTLIAYHSPWAKVGNGAAYGAGISFVGFPFGDITVGKYTWIQTWGPLNVVTGAFIGGLPSLRQAWFLNDGSIGTFLDPSTNETAAYQHAGFWIPCTFYGGALHDMSDGGHLLFLQIAP